MNIIMDCFVLQQERLNTEKGELVNVRGPLAESDEGSGVAATYFLNR